MPGMWVHRDSSGAVQDVLDDDEISARLRASGQQDPESDPTDYDGSELAWYRIDRYTVGQRLLRGGATEAFYRLEFDVFEGREPDAPMPALELVNAARHMGVSLVEYLDAPGSATATAKRECRADRDAAVAAADDLLHTLRRFAPVRDSALSYDMRMFLRIDNADAVEHGRMPELSAYSLVKTALMAVLTRLSYGSPSRAEQVFTEVSEKGCTVAHVITAWQQRWLEDDFHSRTYAEKPSATV